MPDITLKQAAEDLARRRFPVFPCQVRVKRPATTHGLKDASIDPQVVDAWWRNNPNFNVAIRTGDPIFVVDVDGDDGAASLAKLEADHYELPDTVEVKTSRGRHVDRIWNLTGNAFARVVTLLRLWDETFEHEVDGVTPGSQEARKSWL